MIREYRLDIVCDSNGDSTDTFETIKIGTLEKVQIDEGTFDANWDMTFTSLNPFGDTETILTLTNKSTDLTLYPRVVVHGDTGAALTGTQGGDTRPVIISGPLKIVTGDGGNVKTASVAVYIKD